MKKNKMMRTASGLLVATLLSTSIIAGTFAKYTTTAEGSDSARVAKWGIQMDNTGSSTFSTTYDAAENATVKSSGQDDVIAPGTSGSATYKVSGAPETAYEITFNGTKDNDVFLKQGLKYSYTDSTENSNATYTKPAGATAGTVENADYYPVNYSVKIERTGSDNNADITFINAAGDSNNAAYVSAFGNEMKFETLDEAMKALNNTKIKFSNPNTEAGLTVTISWNWQFDKDSESKIEVTNGHEANDVYDTVLGDIAAKNGDLSIGTDNTLTKVGENTAAAVENQYNTQIGYKLTMTATQVD